MNLHLTVVFVLIVAALTMSAIWLHAGPGADTLLFLRPAKN
jgi:hypothetical protein